MPPPIGGGSVEMLRPFLNVRSDADFVLVTLWVLWGLRNHGPYPVLVLGGEQGSAKSTFSAMLRALLDPNAAPLRALPREDRDLFIAADNAHILVFDNVSGLPGWISDTLCRLATGAGFAVRRLYSDQDEVLFNAARPVILNGIEDIVSRPDLADRAIFIRLPPIPEERRQSERDLWATFEAARPSILGALLDAMVQGLVALPHTRLDTMPRMADFALFATACEASLWPTGTFLRAFALMLCARSWKLIAAAFVVSLLWPLGLAPSMQGLFVDLWFGFLLGVGAYYAWRTPPVLPWFLTYTAVIVAAAMWRENVFALTCAATAAVIVAVALAGRIDSLNWRGLQFLGAISYSLHLIHNPVTGATFRVWFTILGRSPVTEWTGWLVSIAASVIAAYLLWLLVERHSIDLARRFSNVAQRS